MSDFGLLHKVASYKKGNVESLLNTLGDLSNGDCDFNGENGLGYVCDEAKEKGFESNQDYYLSIALSELNQGISEEEVISNYLKSWLDNDNYYNEWGHDVIVEDKTGFISLAALTYC